MSLSWGLFLASFFPGPFQINAPQVDYTRLVLFPVLRHLFGVHLEMQAGVRRNRIADIQTGIWGKEREHHFGGSPMLRHSHIYKYYFLFLCHLVSVYGIMRRDPSAPVAFIDTNTYRVCPFFEGTFLKMV